MEYFECKRLGKEMDTEKPAQCMEVTDEEMAKSV